MLERNCMAKLKINLQNPVWLSLGALFCCVLWGSAFPCVKIAYPLFKISDTGSQILFAGVRFFISGIITFIVGCILEKRILRVRKLSIPGIIRQGLLQTTIQYTCFHISLAYISSSESVIINASNVFISVIAAHFLLKNERLSWETIFGCIAGLAGVILINLTGILNGSFSFRGEGLMLAAAASYGISNVYLKKNSKTGITDGNYVISDSVWKSANDNNRNLYGRTSTGIFLKGSLSSFVFGSTICSSFQYMDAAVKI